MMLEVTLGAVPSHLRRGQRYQDMKARASSIYKVPWYCYKTDLQVNSSEAAVCLLYTLQYWRVENLIPIELAEWIHRNVGLLEVQPCLKALALKFLWIKQLLEVFHEIGYDNRISAAEDTGNADLIDTVCRLLELESLETAEATTCSQDSDLRGQDSDIPCTYPKPHDLAPDFSLARDGFNCVPALQYLQAESAASSLKRRPTVSKTRTAGKLAATAPAPAPKQAVAAHPPVKLVAKTLRQPPAARPAVAFGATVKPTAVLSRQSLAPPPAVRATAFVARLFHAARPAGRAKAAGPRQLFTTPPQHSSE
jgi:hypothetical protein